MTTDRITHEHDWLRDDQWKIDRLLCECGAWVPFEKAHSEWVKDGSHGTVHDKADELWRTALVLKA